MKHLNRFIAIFLCLLILSSALCLSVGADVIYTSGNWSYTKINNDKELEIYSYNGTLSEATTPSKNNGLPVTSVGSGAFRANTVITKITLNTNISVVKEYAFYGCENLLTVVIRGNIKSIGFAAFYGCSALESIDLKNTSIESVTDSCFSGCSSLTEITLPETVTAIEAKAFANCSSLKKIVIPASVESISGDAFVGRSDELTIYCYTDSLAHRYAENNSIDYVLIDQILVETYLLGDVNNDGDVSITDASHIQLFLVGKKECDDKGVIRGDVDLDGELTVVDASLIQRFLAAYKDEKGKYINEVFEFPVSY